MRKTFFFGRRRRTGKLARDGMRLGETGSMLATLIASRRHAGGPGIAMLGGSAEDAGFSKT